MHVHILPGVDDGATSLEVALAMARLAVEDGITDIVCTSHMSTEGSYNERLATHDSIRLALQEHIDEAGIPLRLWAGAEWMLSPELLDTVKTTGRLGTGTTFLFELGAYMPLEAALYLAEDAVSCGLHPILAHPERYFWFSRDGFLSSLQALEHKGCVFQLTAGSLLGLFGREPRRKAEVIVNLFSKNVVIASDAHNITSRKPLLTAGYGALDALSPGLGKQAKGLLADILCLKK